MSIGPDLKEVFDDLGVLLTIEKSDGTMIPEYVDVEINQQASSPFLTQFILNCTFSYDTQVLPGNVLVDEEGTYYLLASFLPSRFENQVIAYEGILYRCNVLGTLKEASRSRTGVNYSPGWTIVEDNVHALLTGMPDEHTISDQKYGEFTSFGNNLHLSGDVDIKVGHRFVLSSGDMVEVTGVEPRRLNNVTICKVREDNRE